MDIDQLRHELSDKGKNGIAFLISASVLWFVFAIIYMQSFSLQIKNIVMLLMTGLLFPLAVGVSKIIRANWKHEGHVLNHLGLVLNFSQFIYFPIIFWAFLESPEKMIIFFAVITGAHFFPYGWYYQAMGYYVMAPVISVTTLIISWMIEPLWLWVIPLFMVFCLVILTIWLWIDYRRKMR